jgi:hypothetical protein
MRSVPGCRLAICGPLSCNTAPYPHAVNGFRGRPYQHLFVPALPGVARSGPNRAAGSDVLQPGNASGSVHVSPAVLRFSPEVAARGNVSVPKMTSSNVRVSVLERVECGARTEKRDWYARLCMISQPCFLHLFLLAVHSLMRAPVCQEKYPLPLPASSTSRGPVCQKRQSEAPLRVRRSKPGYTRSRIR